MSDSNLLAPGEGRGPEPEAAPAADGGDCAVADALAGEERRGPGAVPFAGQVSLEGMHGTVAVPPHHAGFWRIGGPLWVRRCW